MAKEDMTQTVIALVITVVIAAVLFASILSPYLARLTNETDEMYAGATASPIVGIITVFWNHIRGQPSGSTKLAWYRTVECWDGSVGQKEVVCFFPA